MVTKRQALTLARKLKYRQKLTTEEKLVLYRAGWIKYYKTKKGFDLTPKAKKKLRTLRGLI